MVDRHLTTALTEVAKELPVGHIRVVTAPTLFEHEGIAGAVRLGFPKPPPECQPKLNDPVVQRNRARLIECLRHTFADLEGKLPILGIPLVFDVGDKSHVYSNQTPPPEKQDNPPVVAAGMAALISSNGVTLGPGEMLLLFDNRGIPVEPRCDA